MLGYFVFLRFLCAEGGGVPSRRWCCAVVRSILFKY
jgi:hypothetical protein